MPGWAQQQRQEVRIIRSAGISDTVGGMLLPCIVCLPGPLPWPGVLDCCSILPQGAVSCECRHFVRMLFCVVVGAWRLVFLQHTLNCAGVAGRRGAFTPRACRKFCFLAPLPVHALACPLMYRFAFRLSDLFSLQGPLQP